MREKGSEKPAVWNGISVNKKNSTTSYQHHTCRVVVEKSRIGSCRSLPIRQEEGGWNCIHWVEGALQTLEMDISAIKTMT